MWIGAFAAGVGLAFLVMKYGPSGGGGGGVSVPIMGPTVGAALLMAAPAPDDDGRDWVKLLTGTKAKLAGLAVATLGIAAAMAVVAFLGWGIWSAVAVTIGLVVGAASPWVYVRILFTPALQGVLSKAFLHSRPVELRRWSTLSTRRWQL